MIYITGDLHGGIDISKLSSKCFAEQKILSKNDYVIICGDFGCVWNNSRTDNYWIKWLESKNFTTLFVDGNHENFNLLTQYPTIEKFGGKVGQISKSIFHLKRGEIYSIGTKNIFAFGGAKSIDVEYRIKDISWWEQEIPSLKEKEYGLQNLKNFNYDIDIVISHTCPAHIFDYVVNNKKKVTEVEEYLEKVMLLLENYKIDYQWYFGHFHRDVTVNNKFNCLYKSILKVK